MSSYTPPVGWGSSANQSPAEIDRSVLALRSLPIDTRVTLLTPVVGSRLITIAALSSLSIGLTSSKVTFIT